LTVGTDEVVRHFTARAAKYDTSSAWCGDAGLVNAIVDLASPGPADRLLDVACGTGLVSKGFAGRVGRRVGLDITEAMAGQAAAHLDELVIAPAERMPFPDESFEIVVSRQGIQFMDLPAAIEEMFRVLAPGGRLVLVNLCAYGPHDSAEYFEILRLRNPVRRHFFLPGDVENMARTAGFRHVAGHRYVSIEDVDAWSDNGAISGDRREAIRNVYRSASAEFLNLHSVEMGEGRLVDHMLFIAVSAIKPDGAR
jgi:SAM-dependent methyltransferase